MAIQSQGCKFFWSTSTNLSTAYAIGEVKSFSGPSGSAGVIDITHLGSLAKEKLIGLRDEGQVTFECNLMTSSSAGQMNMKNDRANRYQKAWSIKLTDPSTSRLNGLGYCTGFSISGGVDDVVKASITIEIDGPVSWTTA